MVVKRIWHARVPRVASIFAAQVCSAEDDVVGRNGCGRRLMLDVMADNSKEQARTMRRMAKR